nr:MAG TPA: hypothetical protein [Caudoviricetes sp.]
MFSVKIETKFETPKKYLYPTTGFLELQTVRFPLLAPSKKPCENKAFLLFC